MSPALIGSAVENVCPAEIPGDGDGTSTDHRIGDSGGADRMQNPEAEGPFRVGHVP